MCELKRKFLKNNVNKITRDQIYQFSLHRIYYKHLSNDCELKVSYISFSFPCTHQIKKCFFFIKEAKLKSLIFTRFFFFWENEYILKFQIELSISYFKKITYSFNNIFEKISLLIKQIRFFMKINEERDLFYNN